MSERKLSPQGYNITKDPTNTNPFWDEDIPAGRGVPAGGTTGQVLAKKSDADYDTEWTTAGGGSVTVDASLSETSTNPVQNRVITQAITDNFEALSAEIETKQDQLAFDSTPLRNSQNPVTSNGILSAIDTAEQVLKDYVDDKTTPQTFSVTYSVAASSASYANVSIVVPKRVFTLTDGQKYRATLFFTGHVDNGATGKAPSPGFSVDFIYRNDSTFRQLTQRIVDLFMTVIDYDGDVETESEIRAYGPGTGYLTTIYTGTYDSEDTLLRLLLRVTARSTAITMFTVSVVLYDI